MAKHKEMEKEACMIFRAAVKSGRLVRPRCCSECGGKERTVDGHHEDYSKPLDVEWLCRGCHVQRHRKKPQPGPRDKTLMDSKYLERARLKNGMTQAELARKIGITHIAYASILKRRSAHPHTIKALIDFLSLDPDKLIPDPKEAD